MSLSLVTAGESHGPALVAIATGLPAGLALDRDKINHDLWRRQHNEASHVPIVSGGAPRKRGGARFRCG